MCKRWREGHGPHLLILGHNINKLTNLKLQHARDVAAELDSRAPALPCLQETKLETIHTPPGYHVEHAPRVGQGGGGVTTLVPLGLRVLRTARDEAFVYMAVQLGADVIAHIVNVYLPPTGPSPARDAWERVL